MGRHKKLSHRCEAHGCRTVVPPTVLMCRTHWALLPKGMRFRLIELDRPSVEYTVYAENCVEYLRRAC